MCSLGDDEHDEIGLMKFQPLQETSNLDCKKCCSRKAIVVLRKKDPYCGECFLATVIHKFRATLGKSKLIRHGDKVLIGYSGDAACCALLNLVKTGLSESTHKRLRFEPIALFIDDSLITLKTNEEWLTRIKNVQGLVENEQIPIFMASISDVLKPKPSFKPIGEEFLVQDVMNAKIKDLFASVSSLTAKQDLLKKFRQKILLDCAKEMKCTFILVADTATKLAANLLSSVSIGGGSHLSSDVGFCDARDNIKVLRPMRDFTSDDLNNFIKINCISHLPHISLATDDNPYACIQSLTKKFVNDLQENFPATISTVLRTGEKMENTSINNTSEEDMCALCLSQLDTQNVACSALQATDYSRLMSNPLKPDCRSGKDEEPPKCGDCTCKPSQDLKRSEIENFLCYSCRLIIMDVKDVTLLPQKLFSSIEVKKSLKNTRSQIQDFLL